MKDQLVENFKCFREQETQIYNEIISILNRSVEEYSLTELQVVGILESIKHDALNKEQEEV